MLKKYNLVTLLLFPSFLFAQSSAADIIKQDCDSRVFTSMQQLPGFTISKEAFQDSLATYFKENNVSIKNTKFVYTITITKNSRITDVHKFLGSHDNEAFVLQALSKFSYLLTPAQQNTYLVCASVVFEVAFTQENILVDIRAL